MTQLSRDRKGGSTELFPPPGDRNILTVSEFSLLENNSSLIYGLVVDEEFKSYDWLLCSVFIELWHLQLMNKIDQYLVAIWTIDTNRYQVFSHL